MTTNPNYRLSLQAFPQSWDGTQITLRILVMPQGDPTSALLTGVAPAPDSPAFADANLSFVAALIPSLDALPTHPVRADQRQLQLPAQNLAD